MNIKTMLSGKTDSTLVQIFRFLLVGGLAFIADYGVMTVCVELLDINEYVAVGLGFLVGLLTNFFISRFWVFTPAAKGKMSKAKEFSLFSVFSFIGLLLTEGIVWVFIHPLAQMSLFGALAANYYLYIGKIVATAVVMAWNFITRKFIIYRA